MDSNNYLKRKKLSLIYIILIALYTAPFILGNVFFFKFGLEKSNFSMFFLFFTFSTFLLLVFRAFYVKYSNFLIYGRENIQFSKEGYKDNRETVITNDINEFDSRVEGIIGERERDIIDKDDDGYILVQEFYPLTEMDVLCKVLRKDTKFSKDEFYEYVRNLFTLMQEAWSNNDYSKLRSFEADRLYFRHKSEIEKLIEADEKDIRDNITIKGVLLKDFRIENNKQILVVALTANMRRRYDYNETQEDYPYIMAFSRNVGVKTNTKVKLSVTNCCNCGAEVNVSDDGICKYCDTSLVSGEHEWVLVDMKLINIDMHIINKKKN